jgi:hypothetical protein
VCLSKLRPSLAVIEGEDVKNPNGFGGVSKLSGKRRLPYIARATTGWTNKGKQKRVTIGYYKTHAQALTALVEYSKAPTSKINITLQELYDEWMQTRAFTGLTKATQNNYEACWNKRLYTLGAERVKDIRTGQLQGIVDAAEAQGLSRSSLSKDKALMTILFDYAVQNDIIHKNYAKYVELPADEKQSDRDAFTDIELARIEAAVSTVPFADCVLMMCYT